MIYGKGVSADLVPAQQVASHMDIAPTLLDLIAPANTQFYSMGHSLFNAAPDRGYLVFKQYVTMNSSGVVIYRRFMSIIGLMSGIKLSFYRQHHRNLLKLMHRQSKHIPSIWRQLGSY